MKVGTGNRNKTLMAVLLGVLALGACAYIYVELFSSDTPASAPVAAAPPAGRATAAQTTRRTGGQEKAPRSSLDPTLHMDAMLVSEALEYSGSGRNIFSPQSAPPPVSIPKPVANARPKPEPPPIPCPPNCPPPPPPPPIDLKYFGIEISSSGKSQACLLHQDNVYLASPGDVVLRRYKVLSIDPKSIRVEDMQNNNTQMLPLLAN